MDLASASTLQPKMSAEPETVGEVATVDVPAVEEKSLVDLLEELKVLNIAIEKQIHIFEEDIKYVMGIVEKREFREKAMLVYRKIVLYI